MKISVIGLDGATWALLDHLMAEGHMPHLQALVGQGVRAPLLSTWPPVTALAWPAFYTGQNPGKHGIYSFVQRQRDGREHIIGAADVRVPALWELLSAAGLSVGVLGVPVTYPPAAVRGFLIPGFLTPPQAGQTAHPAGLMEELERSYGPWTYHVPPIAGEITVEAAEALAAALLADCDRRLSALRLLRQRFQPDLLVTVWMATDTIQHQFWGYLHPGHPRYDRPEAPALRRAILPVYRRLDEIVGELAAGVLPEGALFLMSDHGFGPVSRRLALNHALARHGLLRLRRSRLWASRLRRRLRKWTGRMAGGGPLRHVGRQPGQDDYIDWRGTRAFSGATHELCIHINRADRYGHGIVPPEGLESLRREIGDLLLGLRDEAGQPLLSAVYRPGELYHGPALDLAPDLLLRPADAGAIFTDGLPRHGRLYREEYEQGRGWHRQEGIILLAGAGLRNQAAWQSPPSLLDLAPTLLHLCGYEPPAAMDGRVWSELFLPAPQPLQPLPAARPQRSVSLPGDPNEQAHLAERLRGLGYLE